MRAIVTATEELVDVVKVSYNFEQECEVFKEITDGTPRVFNSFDLSFDLGKYGYPKKEIDWEERRYELAKSALQGLLMNEKYQDLSDGYRNAALKSGRIFDETVYYAELACSFADAAITKLKEGTKG